VPQKHGNLQARARRCDFLPHAPPACLTLSLLHQAWRHSKTLNFFQPPVSIASTFTKEAENENDK
jgi:hypothetical protein